jgi:TorA maturation chaperone TorD
LLGNTVAIQPTFGSISGSQVGEELKEGNRLLAEFTKQVNELNRGERSRLITDLAAEYASLFLGVGPKPVYLVESVYLSKDHLLYQQPYHEVLEAYRRLGFKKEKSFPEPEDHVAVEFEFMANLCTWASKTLENGDIENAIAYLNLQKEFLRDHIIKWVPDLCRKLRSATTSAFYRALAHLTNGFVTLEIEVPDHMKGVLEKGNATK